MYLRCEREALPLLGEFYLGFSIERQRFSFSSIIIQALRPAVKIIKLPFCFRLNPYMKQSVLYSLNLIKHINTYPLTNQVIVMPVMFHLLALFWSDPACSRPIRNRFHNGGSIQRSAVLTAVHMGQFSPLLSNNLFRWFIPLEATGRSLRSESIL